MNYMERPKTLKGVTERIETGCGHIYITVNFLNSKIIEVFATLGKNGGCSMSYATALTKSITVGLRSGTDVSRYIKILKEIRCNNTTYFEGKQILSCSDAIAIILEKYIKEEAQQEALPLDE